MLEMGFITPMTEPFININDTDSVYKKLLKTEMESIELINNENVQLDFETFKDLFFKLPFISDVFRCIMSFSELSRYSLIRVLPTVKVIIPTSDSSHKKVFILSKEFVRNPNF